MNFRGPDSTLNGKGEGIYSAHNVLLKLFYNLRNTSHLLEKAISTHIVTCKSCKTIQVAS